MAGEESNSSGFKVVDRRPFAADGSRKEDIPAEEKEVEAAPEAIAARYPSRQASPAANTRMILLGLKRWFLI